MPFPCTVQTFHVTHQVCTLLYLRINPSRCHSANKVDYDIFTSMGTKNVMFPNNSLRLYMVWTRSLIILFIRPMKTRLGSR